MSEEEVERKPTTTVKEYLQSASEAIDVFRWMWVNVMTPLTKKKLKVMLVCLGAIFVCLAAQPALIGLAFTALVAKDAYWVLVGIIGFSLCAFLNKFIERIQESAREWVLGLIMGKVDDRISELLLEKSIGQHVQESSKFAASSLDKGKWRALDLAGLLIFEAFPVVTQISVSFIALMALNWISGSIMGTVIVIYIIWSMYLNYRVAKECTPIDKDMRALNRRRIERWTMSERVILSCKEDDEIAEMQETFNGVIERDRNFWLWFIKIASFRGLVNICGFVTVISWGSWLVWNDNIKIGVLYALFAWTTRVSENIWRLGEIEHRINWNLPSVQSMIEVLSLPPAIVDAPDAVELEEGRPHKIEFCGVSHTYPANKNKKVEAPPAVTNVSFAIEPGEKVALIGPSGAGKTTLLKKLLRFDDPTAGHITVDGVNLKQIRQKSWRRGIGYIPQNAGAQILNGTLRYNLTYALNPVAKQFWTDEKIWELMRSLRIDFGKRLTEGLDTKVGPHGLKLSGGEGQRVIIGAAVIKRPWFLIVDEATSSLDPTTEREVQEGIELALKGNISSLIITHRLNTVRRVCTKFVVLRPTSEVKDGDAQVEAIASSFEELYRISPTFCRLADDQGLKIAA